MGLIKSQVVLFLQFLIVSVFFVSIESCAHRRSSSSADKSNSARKKSLLFSDEIGDGKELQWPLRGPVTSYFGRRGWGTHEGIDIDGRTGDTVRSSARGRVVFAGRTRGYGLNVIIQHNNYRTLYAHLSKIQVRRGQTVWLGQALGKVGATGHARGSHLHFEVRSRDNQCLDPIDYLPRRETRLALK